MVENKDVSMSTTVLEQRSEDYTKARTIKAKDLSTNKETSRVKVHDESACILLERAKIIKAMVEQEIISNQETPLEIEQLDLILIEILNLEQLKAIQNRLTQDEIIEFSTNILKASFPGDRFQMIIDEVNKLVSTYSLKENIQYFSKSQSTFNAFQDIWQPAITEESYEDMIEAEYKRMSESFVLTGHTKPINSVAISQDSRFIVSGSKDTTIKVWSAHEHHEYFTLTGHTGEVKSLCITPNSLYIVSGSSDHTIKVWSIPEQQEAFTLAGHSDTILSVAVTANCNFIVSGSEDNTIKIWSFQQRREEFTFARIHPSVAVTPDSRYIVSGSTDCTIQIWDMREQKECSTFRAHDHTVSSVVVTADGKFIVSGSLDKTVKLWNFHEPREEFTFPENLYEVSLVSASSDSRFIVSLSSDGVKILNIHERKKEYTIKKSCLSVAISPGCTFIVSDWENAIKIWSIRDRREDYTFRDLRKGAMCIAFTQNSRFLVIGSSNQPIRIWNIAEQREECKLQADTEGACPVCVTLDGRYVVFQSPDNMIKMLSILRRKEEYTFSGLTGGASSMVLSSDGKFIVSTSGDNTIKMWSIEEQRQICTFSGHTDDIYSVDISADSRWIVSGSEDTTVRLWNVRERKEEYCFLQDSKRIGNIHPVYSVAISPDSRFIVSGSSEIRFWNIQERRQEFILDCYLAMSLFVTLDSRFIVSGSGDNTVRIWNVLEQRLECELTGHNDIVTSVAVSPDGRYIASRSQDRNIKMWGIPERREKCTFNKYTRASELVDMSADGNFIVIGLENTIKIWNVKERREECKLTEQSEIVSCVAVSGDARFVISGSFDKTIKIWNIRDRRKVWTFESAKQIHKIVASYDGKYILAQDFYGTMRILNHEQKRQESFSLTSHSCLMEYILGMNNITNCQPVVTPDFLFLRSKFGILQAAKIHNGDLDFSFDLGVNYSKNAPFSEKLSYYVTKDDPYLYEIKIKLADRPCGALRFNMAHYFCYLGSARMLKILIKKTDFSIKLDIFCRSPFYYAILKKRQDCIDVLLTKIEQMRLESLKNREHWQSQGVFDSLQSCGFSLYDLSILALRTDFPLIIKNSPKKLPEFLSGLLYSSVLIFAKIYRPENLPILQTSFAQNPKPSDFPQTGFEEIPIVLQHSLVRLIGEIGCAHNISLLDSIINCRNTQGLRTPIISYIVTHQFDSIRNWVIFYSFLMTLNIIFLMLIIGLKSSSLSLVIPFLLINALLFTWKITKIFQNFKFYSIDSSDYIDIIKISSSVAWAVLGLNGVSSLYFTWCVTLINLIRGITVFSLFNGTRFYINLIVRSLHDIMNFYVMLAYSTFTFGFLLMVSRDQGLSFISIWEDSYDLNFGSYNYADSGDYTLQCIVYFGATFINVVLMLNLLISILGDSYDKFQMEEVVIDIKEKARISVEIQSMMFWKKKESVLKCLRLCSSGFEEGEEMDWEGKMRFMDKKLERSIKELGDSNKSAITSIETKIKELVDSNKSTIGLMDTKINDINRKIEIILNCVNK